MKFSKRCEYALRALIDLGVAAELGRPVLQLSELAAKEKLPVKFIEQIFSQLKAAGYVKSTRASSRLFACQTRAAHQVRPRHSSDRRTACAHFLRQRCRLWPVLVPG
jgi:hypothetical protein